MNTATPHDAQEFDASSPTIAPAKANYVLVILFLVTMLNFIDRQVIAIIAEPIKNDLGLSDTQLGLVSGLSFAIFYTTLAIPVAALADRWNRSYIISIAIAIWSGMTVLCGFANNFLQLFLARMGVSIGEAGSGPASHSLIADLFPPERRTGALGILGASIPLGAGIAYLGGGWVSEQWGWRAAFFIAGAPGLFLAVLIWFTVRDPRGKIALSDIMKPVPGKMSLPDALKILSRKPAYWHLVFSGLFTQFCSYGLAAFYGGIFIRNHGIPLSEFGLKLAIMVSISGGLGAYLGGRTGNWAEKRNPRYTLNIAALVNLIAIPAMIAAVYADTADLAFLWLSIPTFAFTYYYGPSFSAIQKLANDETRAMAVAIYLLIAGIVGLGLGPVFVGLLSDYFAGGDPAMEVEALQKALSILALLISFAGLHLWLANKHIYDKVD